MLDVEIKCEHCGKPVMPEGTKAHPDAGNAVECCIVRDAKIKAMEMHSPRALARRFLYLEAVIEQLVAKASAPRVGKAA